MTLKKDYPDGKRTKDGNAAEWWWIKRGRHYTIPHPFPIVHPHPDAGWLWRWCLWLGYVTCINKKGCRTAAPRLAQVNHNANNSKFPRCTLRWIPSGKWMMRVDWIRGTIIKRIHALSNSFFHSIPMQQHKVLLSSATIRVIIYLYLLPLRGFRLTLTEEEEGGRWWWLEVLMYIPQHSSSLSWNFVVHFS